MSVSARKEFTGRHVLLTGVTGYVGQLLLAKLLALSPDIAQVYVVIRSKQSLSASQRFRDLARTSLAFELVEKSCHARGIDDHLGWIESKCTAVSGDVSKPEFGIQDMKALMETIDVFIHSAADVGFTNTFTDAVRSNLMGTVNALDFAKQCIKRPLFCYVSTAYVSAHQRFDTYVHEAVPVAIPFPAKVLVDAMRDSDARRIEACAEMMVEMKWPNTYVMSKACAENYVLDHHGELPLEIIRPSMIASAWKDISQPGWNKSPQSGATLCTYAIGLGALTIAPIHEHVKNHLDLVPSDYVCNVILAALSTRLYEEKKKSATTDSSATSRIHYAVLGKHRIAANIFFPRTVAYFRKHPMPARIRNPRVKLYSGKTFDRSVALRYTAPIKVLKALESVLVGPLAKPSQLLVGAMEMISKLFRVSRWVVEAEFNFNDQGVAKIFNSLVPDEREILWDNLGLLNKEEYIDEFCAGVVKLMAEEERAKAKTKMQIKSNL